ncbi:MAG TPA: hypothetical protein VFS21_04950 [Roseiflexaceae bacterium]|nr:hypothetical protein [Roseiflexaceae bacterium]
MPNRVSHNPPSPQARLLLEGAALLLVVALALAVWLRALAWYEASAPVAPLPEGAQLLRRDAVLAEEDLLSGVAPRPWYTERYSSELPYAELEAFYQGKGDAWPLGWFSVELLPPEAGSRAAGLPAPDPSLRRDKADPPEATIIVLEIAKTPLDRRAATLVSLLFPLALLGGAAVLLRRYRRAQRDGQGVTR